MGSVRSTLASQVRKTNAELTADLEARSKLKPRSNVETPAMQLKQVIQ